MSYDLEPTVGKWYNRIDDERTFKVIRFDEDNDVVKLHHANGEVEEISGDAWREMDLEIGPEPEDWVRGDAEEVEEDDVDEDEEDDDDDDSDDDEFPEDEDYDGDRDE